MEDPAVILMVPVTIYHSLVYLVPSDGLARGRCELAFFAWISELNESV